LITSGLCGAVTLPSSIPHLIFSCDTNNTLPSSRTVSMFTKEPFLLIDNNESKLNPALDNASFTVAHVATVTSTIGCPNLAILTTMFVMVF
jgi:hypothetical protein